MIGSKHTVEGVETRNESRYEPIYSRICRTAVTPSLRVLRKGSFGLGKPWCIRVNHRSAGTKQDESRDRQSSSKCPIFRQGCERKRQAGQNKAKRKHQTLESEQTTQLVAKMNIGTWDGMLSEASPNPSRLRVTNPVCPVSSKPNRKEKRKTKNPQN